MERDPALHILKSDLIAALKALKIEKPIAMAYKIFQATKSKQIKNRVMVRTNAAQTKRLTKRGNAACPLKPERFWRILYTERIKHKHTTITPINQGDSAWTMLTEIARDAYEFGEMFPATPLDAAYHRYVDIGLTLMGRGYGLNKFKYFKEKIFETQGRLVLVEKDPDKEATDDFQAVWEQEMQAHSKVSVDITVLDRAHFIYARVEAEKANASYRDWIAAQFKGLAFLNTVPNLTQFHTPDAAKRYTEYTLKHGLKKQGEVTHDIHSVDTGHETDAYYQLLSRIKQREG